MNALLKEKRITLLMNHSISVYETQSVVKVLQRLGSN